MRLARTFGSPSPFAAQGEEPGSAFRRACHAPEALLGLRLRQKLPSVSCLFLLREAVARKWAAQGRKGSLSRPSQVFFGTSSSGGARSR